MDINEVMVLLPDDSHRIAVAKAIFGVTTGLLIIMDNNKEDPELDLIVANVLLEANRQVMGYLNSKIV